MKNSADLTQARNISLPLPLSLISRVIRFPTRTQGGQKKIRTTYRDRIVLNRNAQDFLGIWHRSEVNLKGKPSPVSSVTSCQGTFVVSLPQHITAARTFTILSLSGGTPGSPAAASDASRKGGPTGAMAQGGDVTPISGTTAEHPAHQVSGPGQRGEKITPSTEDIRVVGEVTDTPKAAENGRHADQYVMSLPVDAPFLELQIRSWWHLTNAYSPPAYVIHKHKMGYGWGM